MLLKVLSCLLAILFNDLEHNHDVIEVQTHWKKKKSPFCDSSNEVMPVCTNQMSIIGKPWQSIKITKRENFSAPGHKIGFSSLFLWLCNVHRLENFESGSGLYSVESASWKQCAGEIKQRESSQPSRKNFLRVFSIFMKWGMLRWVQDRCCRNQSPRCRLHTAIDPWRNCARSRLRHRATPSAESSKMCLNALWINIKLFSFFLHVFFVLLVERRRKKSCLSQLKRIFCSVSAFFDPFIAKFISFNSFNIFSHT